MEPADFAVRIEEVMAEECSSYECALLDENEIGVLWTFLIEDTISGYLGIEDNEDTLKIRTATVGLHLKEITGISREDLLDLLELNAELINANFSVVKVPYPKDEERDGEQVFVEEGEDLVYDEEGDEEEDDDETTEDMRDLLIIQTRLPMEAFDPDDFPGLIQNLLFQADLFISPNGEDGDENLDLDDPGDFEDEE